MATGGVSPELYENSRLVRFSGLVRGPRWASVVPRGLGSKERYKRSGAEEGAYLDSERRWGGGRDVFASSGRDVSNRAEASSRAGQSVDGRRHARVGDDRSVISALVFSAGASGRVGPRQKRHGSARSAAGRLFRRRRRCLSAWLFINERRQSALFRHPYRENKHRELNSCPDSELLPGPLQCPGRLAGPGRSRDLPSVRSITRARSPGHVM